MPKSEEEQHHDCINRFIELANELAADGISNRVVAAGLMTASGIFSTFIVLGNSGHLDGDGIGKISDAYRQQLELIQQSREHRDKEQAQ